MASCRRSEVDTRRPFSSVKEAVAIFGERLLAGEAYFHSTSSSLKPHYSPPSPSYSTSSSKFNQDRDEELSKILGSMKKLEAELDDTKREVTLLKQRMEKHSDLNVASDRWGVEEEEEIMEMKCEYLPSLAADVRLGEADGDEFNETMKKKKMKKKKKKKPIIPLIGDLFWRKKDSGEIRDSFYWKTYF